VTVARKNAVNRKNFRVFVAMLHDAGSQWKAIKTNNGQFMKLDLEALNAPYCFCHQFAGALKFFYKQVMALSLDGYRVIAIDIPPFWSLMAFCDCFTKLLHFLDLKKVHIFGASIGGYLAQKYVEYSFADRQVASLILCNSFVNTSIFDRDEASLMYWALPSVVLKRMILGGFPKNLTDSEVVDSVDFMVEQLDALSQEQLASRLTLNCTLSTCDTRKVASLPITIIDVFDECAISPAARDSMYRAYPNARRSSLKSGGNFPYLSRAAETNLHIKLHLRQFNNE